MFTLDMLTLPPPLDSKVPVCLQFQVYVSTTAQDCSVRDSI